ncbi:hypothetical protein POM88_024797 [Heracleum sosnowskyi]|uniref:Uncharacterized protein n=1 Tax=Heracleum sosnowskyi TaxID=360622 RepID=A0AAD8I3I3_9APIA|nr:hypothetical protein POM88_024797 [Heracleum sosnowskyi]
MRTEEERRIRMALLASAGKLQNNIMEPKTQAAAAKICYKCKKAGHLLQLPRASRCASPRPHSGHSSQDKEDENITIVSKIIDEMDSMDAALRRFCLKKRKLSLITNRD